MRSIRLGECFDAVTIPDSINYMITIEELRSAFMTAYKHLKPGGVFLTIVEEVVGKFKQNRTKSTFHSQGDIEVVFIENS